MLSRHIRRVGMWFLSRSVALGELGQRCGNCHMGEIQTAEGPKKSLIFRGGFPGATEPLSNLDCPEKSYILWHPWPKLLADWSFAENRSSQIPRIHCIKKPWPPSKMPIGDYRKVSDSTCRASVPISTISGRCNGLGSFPKTLDPTIRSTITKSIAIIGIRSSISR